MTNAWRIFIKCIDKWNRFQETCLWGNGENMHFTIIDIAKRASALLRDHHLRQWLDDSYSFPPPEPPAEPPSELPALQSLPSLNHTNHAGSGKIQPETNRHLSKFSMPVFLLESFKKLKIVMAWRSGHICICNDEDDCGQG